MYVPRRITAAAASIQQGVPARVSGIQQAMGFSPCTRPRTLRLLWLVLVGRRGGRVVCWSLLLGMLIGILVLCPGRLAG